MVDLKRAQLAAGSIYIGQAEMHGPRKWPSRASSSAASRPCSDCRRTPSKLGIMDEERRTSVNLKACIAEATARVAFINTGFLDRTGDEMHTAMHAGPMFRRAT